MEYCNDANYFEEKIEHVSLNAAYYIACLEFYMHLKKNEVSLKILIKPNANLKYPANVILN